ncbi:MULTISPECIES: HAMP domain-containing sensor histidine kinase [Clostridium]|uniref:histidine kinase n=2 Tax=Clostridium TaxID=1485 RepID=D8GIV0_CLOLD|nr:MULTISPECIES: HAMP domain-containing sensor histidine kinase [Clostridium]ADK15025.1 predicted signal transduction histidine kinase [Clostridium ljungdahlii DSM 13528]AGY74277.1 HAMP domain-containing histidine kinase [Clostridium autoethanogenum DSM 10061]ALU34468.1 Histidine kinase [Clostridium autoethanogenum DSM 10061]OAA87686.1 Sensor histidine kinase YycG [Clostridium ljungdahlii DSM 13528]OVY51188.1 Sensor histidine kinase YycG [Clostridium autoethanogenum]
MKVKIAGIQTKFFISFIFSLIASFCIFTAVYSTYISFVSQKYPYKFQNYNYSLGRLSRISSDVSLNTSGVNFNNNSKYKSVLSKYEVKYSKYKLGFIVTDPQNKILYNSSKLAGNTSLEKTYSDFLKYFNHTMNITMYHDYIYKTPIKTGNDISILWITASPINTPHDSIGTLVGDKNILILLSICMLIFFIITHHRMKYINEMCCGIKTIANENLNFKIRQKGHDELSEISKNINFMADKINEKIENEKKIEVSKNALITNVAHDIRSPLTSIIGFLQIIDNSEYESKEEMQRFINISLKKAETMKKLTDNLFMFTKLNGGDLKLHLSTVCLNELIYQLIDEFSITFENSKLNIVDNICAENIMVTIDINLFVRALNNLMYNALKYSIKPSDVNVSLVQCDKNVLISISNKCKNLNIENVSMLFEKFYRADKSRTNPDEGSGLGLSITKSIIEKHNGIILANYDKDTITFTISLPN